MAWNPSPKVARCRSAAQEFGANKVIMVLLNEAAGTFEVVSYGSTKRECDEAKALAGYVYDAVLTAAATKPEEP